MEYEPRRMESENGDWINYIYSTKLTSKAKLVASVLASYMHGKDEAFPGLGRLAYETSLSKRTVQNAIDELTREGWIVKKSGGVAKNNSLSPNIYRRTWPTGSRPANDSEQARQSTDPIAPAAIGVATEFT